MEKLIIGAVMALSALTANAQLKVFSNGNIRMGKTWADLITINFPDTVNQSNRRFGVYSALGPYTYYNGSDVYCATALYGTTEASGNSPYENTNVAIGVKGEAYGGTDSNFGIYGYIPYDSYNGAGVYGTIYGGYTVPRNSYAGYFNGPVGISESLHVSQGIYGTLYGSVVPLNSKKTNASELNDGSNSTNHISERLASLQLGTYCSNEEGEKGTQERVHYGLEAEQMEEAFPDLVVEDKNGEKYINYVEIVPLLVQSIKELSLEIARLKGEGSETTRNVKSVTTRIGDTNDGIDIVRMDQNKPNPFSGSTIISLNIPRKARQANIFIYDLGGKQVQNIAVNERGKTNITVYASSLAVGMYIYSLVVDGKVSVTRRMIVEK